MSNRQTRHDGLRAVNSTNVPTVRLFRLQATASSWPHRRKATRLAPEIPALVTARPRLPEPDTSLSAVFASPWWKRVYGARRSKSRPLCVYIAGCVGTSTLAGLVGIPTFKVGTAEDCEARIDDLNQQRYGSHAVLAGRMVEESGYDAWRLAKLSARPTHPMSPARVMPRWLVIDLPSFLSGNEFEFMLNHRLEAFQLARMSGTSAGRAQCRQRGCDPDLFMRYSRHGRSLELATELTLIGPSADTARLIGLIEAMLIAVVRAHAGGEG